MSRSEVVEALIAEQGTLYAEEIGANIARNTPQELFHWLEAAILLSGRIAAGRGVEAARALRKAKLHKIDTLLTTEYGDVVAVLRDHGFRRYDESTAGYLQDTARMVRDEWRGDLRRMRHEDPKVVLKRLTAAKGLGDVGAAIFAREAQLVWDEFHPRADGPALTAARDLGLPEAADALAELAGSRERFVRLMAALTRAKLQGPAERVLQAAG